MRCDRQIGFGRQRPQILDRPEGTGRGRSICRGFGKWRQTADNRRRDGGRLDNRVGAWRAGREGKQQD